MARRPSESSTPVAAPVVTDLPPELVTDLEHMRDLLARGDVAGAYAWAKELEKRWPESERVRHYVRVLAPGTARVTPGEGRSYDRERAWLRAHAREYPGCWIAVLEGRLIAADPDLGPVLAAAHQTSDPRHTLIHYQPRPEE
jgi:hypothetical protein